MPEILERRAPGAPWNLEDPVQGLLVCQKGGVGRPCQVIDPGLGKVFPEKRDRPRRQDDVPQGSEADEKNAANRLADFDSQGRPSPRGRASSTSMTGMSSLTG